MSTAILYLLIVQGLLGAADVLINHELREGLPARASARTEQALHGVRELLYAVVFAGLAWFEWRGIWAALFGGVLLIEVVLTAWDFVEEDRTRRLSATERVMHLMLSMGGGAYVALLVPILLTWGQESSQLLRVDHGIASRLLSLLAIGVFAWGVRDLIAALQTHRTPTTPPLDFGPEPRHVLITGATGFIGSRLVNSLLAAGHRVTVLARQPLAASILFQGQVRAVAALEEIGDAERLDAIINLAGAPVIGPRWTPSRKATLLASRVGTTNAIGQLLRRLTHAPEVLINGSAIGYYGARGDEAISENGAPQNVFMSELCQRWEAAAQTASQGRCRLVIFRLGIVFGQGGALPKLLLPFRLRSGGRMGNGQQYMSWVHVEDVLAAFALAMRDTRLLGIYNLTAPESVRQAEFADVCARRFVGGRSWFHLPAFAFRSLLGEAATLFVEGQRVVPLKLLRHGFHFRYPTLVSALDAQLGHRRSPLPVTTAHQKAH